uniref:Chromosome 17 open reading frame 67 n=1 Tax=Suricata suricatta TaxID=37032 RepID=A0A673V5E6_SURSU
MKKVFALVLGLSLLPCFSDASPILPEKQAKQLLRSRRQDRPSKPGFPDEPLQEYMHHLLSLEHRAEEQFLEHWLNPHCKPHCDRNVVHPV